MKDKDEGGDVSGDKYNSEIVQISKQGSWKKIRLQCFKLQRCSFNVLHSFYTGLFYCFLYNYIYVYNDPLVAKLENELLSHNKYQNLNATYLMSINKNRFENSSDDINFTSLRRCLIIVLITDAWCNYKNAKFIFDWNTEFGFKQWKQPRSIARSMNQTTE